MVCKHDVSTVVKLMHISGIYFRLLTVLFKLHIQGANILRYHICEKTPVLSKGGNFLNCFEEFRDEIDHSRADMRQNTRFA